MSIPRNCSDDPNLVRIMLLFADRICQIPSKTKAKHATNFKVIATQFI